MLYSADPRLVASGNVPAAATVLRIAYVIVTIQRYCPSLITPLANRFACYQWVSCGWATNFTLLTPFSSFFNPVMIPSKPLGNTSTLLGYVTDNVSFQP